MSGFLIAVEGPDGAGKDAFVSGLYEFLNQYVPYCTDPRNEVTTEPFSFSLSEQKRANILTYSPNEWPNSQSLLPATGMRVKFVNLREGSPDSADFMYAIHTGDITDPAEIARGYLKLHADYNRFINECLSVYDLVIMNRSLMSFLALQIMALGIKEVRSEFEKLLSTTGQAIAFHVLLLPPKEVIVERASKKNVSVLDNFFTERIDATYEAYSTIAKPSINSAFRNVLCVDKTNLTEFADLYQQITSLTLNNMFRSRHPANR